MFALIVVLCSCCLNDLCPVAGIPVIFVVIGLSAVHEQYGVRDDTGKYK